MNGVPAPKHPIKMYQHKGNRLPTFWQWSAFTWGLKYPNKYKMTPRVWIAKHTPYMQYTVEFPFNAPQFEGLPNLGLEKVDNFSIFFNLVSVSILPQRNIKWGFSCNGVHKENLNICLIVLYVWNFVSLVNLLHPQHTYRYTETYFVLPQVVYSCI
jgi:hypothetical protein